MVWSHDCALNQLPCCCSVAKSVPTLCDTMDCSTPGFPVLHCLPEFAQTQFHELVMTSNHLILCHPPSLGKCESVSCSVVTPWTVALQAPLSMGFSGKSTGVGSNSLLQGIFLTPGLNQGFLHILYGPSHHGSPPQFSCPQSFPTSGSFPVSWLFTSGGQSIGASASASVLPMNIQA